MADLGQYKFYGTPFDMGFNKRSVAHSMLLVVDPDEKFHGTSANDGGSRSHQSHATTPEQLQTNALFQNGRVVSCSFGPSSHTPAFSYYSADLTTAYAKKMARYVRTCCFLNLDNPTNPAAIIVLDHVQAARPEFRKHWQLNTLASPRRTPDGVRLRSTTARVTGQLDVRLLWPQPADRTLEIRSGPATHNVFGQSFAPPKPDAPEARGHRVLFSPKQAQATDRFLAVLQACDEKHPPLPCATSRTEVSVVLRLSNRIVSLPLGPDLIRTGFSLDVPADDRAYQVWVAGLEAGSWTVTTTGDTPATKAQVEAGRNTLSFSSHGGPCRLTPEGSAR